MKKTIAIFCAVMSTAVFAAGGDLLISFSTPGPDKYADGTQVLDGEYYSLVYTKADGSQEVVLNFGGVVGDQVFGAKDGKCQQTVYWLEAADAAKYTGGSWGVYLLDTRVFATDADGKPTVGLAGLDENGQPKVNVKALVAEPITSTGSFAKAGASAGISADAFDLSSVPQPRVTGIQVVGANVYVTVADTKPFLAYALQSGSDVKNFALPESAASGKDGGEITLVAPKKEGAQFFKVTTATK